MSAIPCLINVTSYYNLCKLLLYSCEKFYMQRWVPKEILFYKSFAHFKICKLRIYNLFLSKNSNWKGIDRNLHIEAMETYFSHIQIVLYLLNEETSI